MISNLSRIRSEESSEGKAKMVDVGLESTTHGSVMGDEPPDDLAVEIPPDDDPPSIQQFRKQPVGVGGKSPLIPQEVDFNELHTQPPQPDSEDGSSAPPEVSHHVEEPPRHDSFWGHLYIISVASLFASFCLVYLHTYAPKNPLGDTIYTTLHSSYHLLAIDTLVAVIVSLLWLAVLRSYVRPLVYGILVGVPTILFSFFLYPFISSFKGQAKANNVQDNAMRWLSFIPFIMSILWTITVYKGRYSFGKAISILEFSCRILATNPGLLALGFATLIGVIAWTWIWMAMFTRVFLGGHFASTGRTFFVIDTGTWWLAIFFIIVYMWTLAVGAGVQRATTAATVSQWYFHRLTVPAPSSQQILSAALNHATTTLFGTICLSTLLSLLIRLPFLILPRRVFALVGLFSYTLIPSTIATYTSPLTLTYAAVHSQPLSHSSRAISRLSVLPPITTQDAPPVYTPRHNAAKQDLLPYTLSLLLLRATRFITSLALGFVGWVSTAKQLRINATASASNDATIKGSLYAYVVGLIAAAIGWGVLGAIDGVLTGVVDALVVCWGSEKGNGRGQVRYCREADRLFGAEQDGDEETGRLRGGGR